MNKQGLGGLGVRGTSDTTGPKGMDESGHDLEVGDHEGGEHLTAKRSRSSVRDAVHDRFVSHLQKLSAKKQAAHTEHPNKFQNLGLKHPHHPKVKTKESISARKTKVRVHKGGTVDAEDQGRGKPYHNLSHRSLFGGSL